MKTNIIAIVSLLVVTAGLAGCTGEFQVDQTEPIQVEVDGERQSGRASEASEQRFVVDNPDQAEEVNVEVTVKSVSEDPATVIILVEDADGQELAREEISTGDATGDEDDGEDTTNETDDDTGADSEATTQEINVDVKGKDNFVVIAQSEEGEADIDISATSAEGGSTVDGEDGNTTA